MKQVLSIFLNLFTWYPGSKWVIRTGLAFLGAALLAVAFPAPEPATKLVKLSYIALLVFPYLGLPGHFRTLLANKRLGLVPGFYLSAGIAVLLFTLVTSVYYQAMTLLLGLESLAPGTVLFFFIFASGYMTYTQLVMTSKYSPYFMMAGTLFITYILFIIATQTGLAFVTTYDSAILTAALLALAGWCWTLYYVATHDRYSPARSIFMPCGDKESFQGVWNRHDRHPLSSTTSGTLLLGLPDGLYPQLHGGVLWIMVFPGAMALMFVLMNALVPGNPMPPATWSFLVASGFLGGCCTMANGEFAARSRLLWLRYGSDRGMLWRHMEKVLLRNWSCVYASALLIAILAAALSLFAGDVILNYLLFIPVCAFFMLYLSLASRITGLPAILKAVIFMVCMVLVIWAVSRRASNGHFYALNALEVIMVLAGILLRTIARNSFLNIDWYQVRPFSLAAIQGLR